MMPATGHLHEWTDAMEAQLRRMWCIGGFSYTEIGNAMGLTRSTVAGRVAKLGLAGKGARTCKPNRAPRPNYYKTRESKRDVGEPIGLDDADITWRHSQKMACVAHTADLLRAGRRYG